MTNEDTPRGEITAEVIQTIADLMADVLGRKAVDMILQRAQDTSGSGADIMYAFAEQAQTILGPKGAFATLRQTGRELAKSLMGKTPQDQWADTLRDALSEFGFANRIDREGEQAFICHCVFYEKLRQAGLQPTEHTVCWAGWGFIEGFMKAMEGVNGIEWVARDETQHRCQFNFIR